MEKSEVLLNLLLNFASIITTSYWTQIFWFFAAHVGNVAVKAVFSMVFFIA